MVAIFSACFTLLDRPSFLSFLCLLAGARSRFLIRLVNPSPGMMFEGTPGKTEKRSLEQQLNPVHTPPLECWMELLLSGHVGTNLHVTGLCSPLEPLSSALMSSHCCGNTNDSWTEGAGGFNLAPTLMIASLIAFVAAVAKWFNGITGRVKLKVDSLLLFLAGLSSYLASSLSWFNVLICLS